MKSRNVKGLSVMGGIILIASGVLVNYGSGVPSASAATAPPNPLTVVIDKLNQILAAIGGVQEGNHTLRWDTNNPSATRFTTAFTGAVLDKNTGLVWEQAPDGTFLTWFDAAARCVNRNVGGTVGWRLPSVVELKSVQDGSPGAVAPFVPASVFSGVQSSDYWSATTSAGNPTSAWLVLFSNGNVSLGNKTVSYLAWCVRGGMNADAY
jgi:hypothetical protein